MNISQQTLDKMECKTFSQQGYHDLEDYLRSIARYQDILYTEVLLLSQLFTEDQLFDELVDAVAYM